MKRLLLLIDFQEGFLNNGTSELRDRIQSLVVDSRFATVLATKFINLPGGPWRTVLGWEGLQTDDEQKIAVDLPKNARVIEKSTYSLPLPVISNLAAEWPPGSIYLAGLETDVCVAICAAQLFDHDSAPYVIADCTGTTKGDTHQEHALMTLRRIVGRSRVVNLDSID